MLEPEGLPIRIFTTGDSAKMTRTLHRGLLTVLIVGLLAGGVVAAQNGHKQQHSSEQDVQEHIDAVAEELNLTSRQRGALSSTIDRAHEFMREFHQLHTDLMAKLDESQQHSLNTMLHHKMAEFMSGCHGEQPHCGMHQHGATHGGLHGASHEAPHKVHPADAHQEGSGSVEL